MNKYIIYILFLTVTATTMSCNKWLEVKPKGDTEREEFYNSEEGFKKALTGCYMKLKDKELYGLKLTTTTIEFLSQHWLANSDNEKALLSIDMSNQIVKDEFDGIYKKQYNVIVQVNDILHYLTKKENVITTPNLRDMIAGEAYALRAFCHFDLLRLYGQMPNNATIFVSLPYAEEMTVEAIPYYNFEQFAQKVLDDLIKAETLLKKTDPLLIHGFESLNAPNSLISNGTIPDDFYAYRKTRMNYYAVKALMARVYLYMGNKDMARQCADAVINAKNSSGTPVISLSSQEIGSGFYTMPSEVLFNLHVYNIADYMNPLFRNLTYLLASPMKAESLMLRDLFNNKSSDSRYPLWFAQKASSGMMQLTIKKYWQPDLQSGAGITHQVIPLIRLSEMHLIAIECASSVSEANRLMREFKAMRGYGPTDYTDLANDELIRAEIQNEYRREFWAEGQMFFAYKRMGATIMKWKTEKIMESQYIAPLTNMKLK